MLQQALDDAYKSRSGWLPEEIRSGLIARLGQLRFELLTPRSRSGRWRSARAKDPNSNEGRISALVLAGVELWVLRSSSAVQAENV